MWGDERGRRIRGPDVAQTKLRSFVGAWTNATSLTSNICSIIIVRWASKERSMKIRGPLAHAGALVVGLVIGLAVAMDPQDWDASGKVHRHRGGSRPDNRSQPGGSPDGGPSGGPGGPPFFGPQSGRTHGLEWASDSSTISSMVDPGPFPSQGTKQDSDLEVTYCMVV
jgi:hypothetical protein